MGTRQHLLCAPAVHYGPNQVIADSAGSVFTLQLMEVDHAKTTKSKPFVSRKKDIHWLRMLDFLPQINFLKPWGSLPLSAYLSYLSLSISILSYLVVYSQVSALLLSIAPRSVAIFGAPAASRRNLAELAMDNESTETSTPKHSRGEESAGARAAMAPPVGKPWPRKDAKQRNIFSIFQTMIVKYCQLRNLINYDKVIKVWTDFFEQKPAEGMAPTLQLKILKVGCRPKQLPSRSSGDDEAANAEAPSTPAPKQKASETPGCNSCRHLQTSRCCFNIFQSEQNKQG